MGKPVELGSMIFRVIALSVALFIGIGAVVPVVTNYTEAGAIKHKKNKKKHRKYKRYSKKWWRTYHARLKRKKLSEARKRILRLRRIRLLNARLTDKKNVTDIVPTNKTEELFIVIEGKVKNVYNGDTINVRDKEGKDYLIRMLGIDAPEIKQDFGDKSRKKLSDLILRKNVTVIIRKKNSPDLCIGTVYFGGQDINLRQLETGMAWYLQQKGYEAREGDRKIYTQAEKQSRTERKGLWRRQDTNASLESKR